MKPPKDITGNQVRKVRHKVGMTQKEFAELIGYTRESLARIESFKNKKVPEPRKMAIICEWVSRKCLDMR